MTSTLFESLILIEDRNGVTRTLYENAFLSVIKDYSDIVSGDLMEILHQFEVREFRLLVIREEDPEHQGVLIYRGEGESAETIAFVSFVKQYQGRGLIVTIQRIDRDRVDTLEMQRIMGWN